MTDYYLRVSVKETETKLQQYNLFTDYPDYHKKQDILKQMLEDVIRAYRLDSSTVLVEQFSKI